PPAAHAGESSAGQSKQAHSSGRQERHAKQVASRQSAPRGPPGAPGGAGHGEPEWQPYHQARTEGAERPGTQHQRTDSAEVIERFRFRSATTGSSDRRPFF